MPITAHLSRLVVYGLPLAFVVMSWLGSASFPSVLDGDQSFVAVLQTRAAAHANARGDVSLAARPGDRQRPTSVTFSSHQPSVPRLLHYLLLGAGLRDPQVQALIVSLLGTGLTGALLWRLFGHPPLTVVALAFVLDYSGFLAWTLNPSRIWMFVFFLGMVLAIARNRPIVFAALAFGLVQLDFRVAVFVGAVTLAFAGAVWRWQGLPFALGLALAPALSLGIHAVEVLTFYGQDGLLGELAITHAWLASLATTGAVLGFLHDAVLGPVLLFKAVAFETHSGVVFVMVIAAVVTALFALNREWIGEPHRFVAQLVLSTAIGTVLAALLLGPHFVDGFVGASLPLAAFLVAPSVGMVALELRTFVGRLSGMEHVGAVAAAVVLTLLALTSVRQLHPQTDAELLRVLPTEIRDTIPAAPELDPWLAWPDAALGSLRDLAGLGVSTFEQAGPADGRGAP